jgi:outer membrane cobalamin receptor
LGARDAWVSLLACVFAGAAAIVPGPVIADAQRRAAVTSAADSARGDTVVVLPEVRVVERRLDDARDRLPTASISTIHPGARGAAIDLLPELMSQLPGVHVQQYGGLGAFSVVSLRGSSPGQVAVFLNGIPLSSGARSVVNLSDIPISAVEQIEVYRGPSPLSFGMAGPAGAINLVSPGTSRPPELRVTRGSFATWDARGFVTRARGPLSALLHLGYQSSRGDFPYLDDNATPFNAADDSVVRRVNNRFDSWTGLASVGWTPDPRLHVTARGEATSRRQGAPGLGALTTRHAALASTLLLGQIEAAFQPAHRALPRVALRGGGDDTRTRFEDPEAELGFGSHDTDDAIGADHVDLDLAWARLPGGLSLETGGTLRRERARLRDRADAWPDPAPSRRDREGAMAGLSLRPWNGRLLFHAGERWERLEDALRTVGFGGVTSARNVARVMHAPQLGVRAEPGLGFELRANWSKADRAPDFVELFGNQGTVLGNPALEPERIESWDAGASWSAPARWTAAPALTWAHFESRARDLILYGRNSASTVKAMNVTSAKVRGDEFELRAALGALRASASVTLERAVDTGDVPYWSGKRLPQRPGQEGYAQLLWSRGPIGLGADVHALGDNYLDRYNRYRVASRTLAGAWLSFSPSAWPLRLTVEGKNLGDERASDVAGFPLPGRTWFVSAETRLGPSHR